MKLQPFKLERWLLQPCRYDIASAGIMKLKLSDLTSSLDFEMVSLGGYSSRRAESIFFAVDNLPASTIQNMPLTSMAPMRIVRKTNGILAPEDLIVGMMPMPADADPQAIPRNRSMRCSVMLSTARSFRW